MSAVNAVRRAAAVAIRSEGHRRGAATYSDVVCARPANRISFAEKLAHGFLLTVGLLGYPIYTMFKMAEIKREEYAALEIPEEWLEWKEKQK